jgi:hypothetical protein
MRRTHGPDRSGERTLFRGVDQRRSRDWTRLGARQSRGTTHALAHLCLLRCGHLEQVRCALYLARSIFSTMTIDTCHAGAFTARAVPPWSTTSVCSAWPKVRDTPPLVLSLSVVCATNTCGNVQDAAACTTRNSRCTRHSRCDSAST